MRAARLVTILLLLQARGQLTGRELADELEVSLRTIYRDLAHLGAAGVPIYGEKGEGGGYRLLEGYRTNLTGLTEEEASALLLAGAPGPAAQLGLGTLLATTRLKLLAAVPPALRDVATHAAARFYLEPTGWAHVGRRDQPHLEALADAVMKDRRVSIRYERGDRRSVERLVDPIGLVHKTGTWYLVAVSEDQTRVYRVDRVQAVRALDTPVHRPDDFDLAEYWVRWEAEWARGLPTFRVRARLGPLAQRHRDSFGGLTPQSAEEDDPGSDGWVAQTLVFDDRRVAIAALLALSPDVEVLEPHDLREELIGIARQAIDRQARLTRRSATPRRTMPPRGRGRIVQLGRGELDPLGSARRWTRVSEAQADRSLRRRRALPTLRRDSGWRSRWLAPGLVSVKDVLQALIDTVPIEATRVMASDAVDLHGIQCTASPVAAASFESPRVVRHGPRF